MFRLIRRGLGRIATRAIAQALTCSMFSFGFPFHFYAAAAPQVCFRNASFVRRQFPFPLPDAGACRVNAFRSKTATMIARDIIFDFFLRDRDFVRASNRLR